MTDVSSIHNVVVRLPNWIGDAVMALPAVNVIKRSFPHIHLSLLGKRSVNLLYRYGRRVDRVIDLNLPEGKARLTAIKSFSRNLRQYRFDLGLVLPKSFSSALIFRLGGVKTRVGYRSELRSFLLTDPIKLPANSMHRSGRYMHLVCTALGIDIRDGGICIPVSERESQAAGRFLDDLERFAVVCPTSRAPSRRWGKQKYAQLIKHLSGDLGLGVVLAGSGDETKDVDEVGRLSGVAYRSLADCDDLLLSVEVMRRSEVFVGNDSGAAHLAAASGTRVVSISGADDPGEPRPLARIGAIVRKDLDCSPCVKNVCPRKDHANECMDIVSVDDVLPEVESILQRTQ